MDKSFLIHSEGEVCKAVEEEQNSTSCINKDNCWIVDESAVDEPLRAAQQSRHKRKR
jgi:hypothetical protein